MPNTDAWPTDGPFRPPLAPLVASLPEMEEGLRLREVIVPDQPLQVVPEPWTPPYSAIGMVRDATRLRGSGFLVAPRLVLTAAHLFPDSGGLPQGVHVLLAGGRQTIAVINAAVLDPASHASGSPGDALLLLLAHPPAGIAPISLPGPSPAPRPGLRVEISGYPGDNPPHQLRHAGRLAAVDGTWLDYQVNTLPGHSGAPVLLAEPGTSAIALGLHVLESGSHPTLFANRGIRITDRIVDWIRSLSQ